MRPLILTYTGKHVNPLDLRSEDIDIRDIAHALAQCNRFAGQAKRPISVAQHSVYVSRLVASQLDNRGQDFLKKFDRLVCIQALLHDASEAYLGDVTKWLKATDGFAAYRVAEDHIQRQIYAHFNCATEMHEMVAAADKLMLRFEGEQAFGVKMWKKWTTTLSSYPMITPEEKAQIGPWYPWGWRWSEELFLVHARSLGLLEEDRPRNERGSSRDDDRKPGRG